MKRLSKFAGVAGVAVLASAPTFAQAADPTAALFAAVDISSIATSIGTLGVAIIGIAMAMKGISVVKRAVSKI